MPGKDGKPINTVVLTKSSRKRSLYNRIHGRNLDRLAALRDGMFAVVNSGGTRWIYLLYLQCYGCFVLSIIHDSNKFMIPSFWSLSRADVES
ncbi:MAG: hypothetical protein WDM87_01730 [Terracidiphilus sp.]